MADSVRVVGKNPNSSGFTRKGGGGGRSIADRIKEISYYQERDKTGRFGGGGSSGSGSDGGIKNISQEEIEATGALKVENGQISLTDQAKVEDNNPTFSLSRFAVQNNDYGLFTRTQAGTFTQQFGQYKRPLRASEIEKPRGALTSTEAAGLDPASKQKNPFYSTYTQAKGTFLSLMTGDREDLYQRQLLARTGTGAQALGFTGGMVTGIAFERIIGGTRQAVKGGLTWAAGAARATKWGIAAEETAIAQRLISGAKTLQGVANYNAATRLVTGGAQAYGEFKVIEAVGGGITRLNQNKVTDQRLLTQAVSAGFAEQRNAVQKQGMLNIPGTNKQISPRSILYEISPFLAKREDYERGTYNYLLSQGMTEPEAAKYLDAARTQYRGRGITELVGLLNISRFSERFGRKETALAFERFALPIERKGAGVEVFKKAFFPIGRAGFIEGSISELQQQSARGQKTDLKTAAITGGFGFGTAGLLGGAIAGTAINKKGVSAGLQTFSYLSDPFEFAGDKVADAQEALLKKVFKTKVITPTISITGETEKVTLGSNRVKSSIPTPAAVATNIFNVVNTNVFAPTATAVTTLTEQFVPIGLPVGTPVPVPTNTGTPVPTPINPNTNTNTNINTNIGTPVPVPVNINIPTPTPQMRLPPPILPAFPAPSGLGLGTRTGKRKKFVNELQAGANLLKGLLK